MGSKLSERKLSIRDVSVHVYGDRAWPEFHWDFDAKFKKNGSQSQRMNRAYRSR
jgi:hypothetical protein